jgi:mannose-6-phosphate isomerase
MRNRTIVQLDTQSTQNLATPLLFTTLYKEKLWGSRNLERIVGKHLPTAALIGETWDICDLGADQSVAESGPWASCTLNAITRGCPADLLGANSLQQANFPLLYKFIDAHDRLSVQVHPRDDDARRLGNGVCGKTECWYIIHAEPGAQIVTGFKPGVSKNDIANALDDNSLPRLLQFLSVNKGDVIFIPAGTVHSIGAGIVLYEIQQSCDSTFRLSDWGRLDSAGQPRVLHRAESLAVLDPAWHQNHSIPDVMARQYPFGQKNIRIACRYFALEEFVFHAQGSVGIDYRDSFNVVTVVSGSVAIGESSLVITHGQSALLPAAMRTVQLAARADTRVLISWVPNLRADIIEPLRACGIPDAAIAALGGNPATNDILPLM